MPPEVHDNAKTHLDETVASLRRRMLTVSAVLRDGLAWEEICASAVDSSADLVVIGSQGRRGLPRLVLGSVAERVVRLSPVPVLTVHPSDYVAILAGGMDRFRHILAPTDFSDASQQGIEAATTLALELDADLTLVHVYDLPSYASLAGEEVTSAFDAQARRDMGDLLTRVRVRCPRAEGLVRQGATWQGILDAGKERGADLIVLSTHGRRGISRVLIGSIAEKIVRLAEVPVVTVGAKGSSACR
jgi:nucleotide-binding universal stress UspA family protein